MCPPVSLNDMGPFITHVRLLLPLHHHDVPQGHPVLFPVLRHRPARLIALLEGAELAAAVPVVEVALSGGGVVDPAPAVGTKAARLLTPVVAEKRAPIANKKPMTEMRNIRYKQEDEQVSNQCVLY